MMDEIRLPESFESVWERVRAAAGADTAEAPQSDSEALCGYIERKRASVASYRALVAQAGFREREALCRIAADERRHLAALEMEHFMLTGDSAAAPKSTYPKTESGFLSALRAAALAEAESAAEHEKAAQERGGELGAVCAAISKDDAEHARVLRGMIARCFRLREE